MLNPNLPRFAHLCVVSLVSACFAPIVPPLEGDGSTSADESTSVSSSPATESGSLDESSSAGEPQFCGNGVLEPGEVCDDGINDGSYGGCTEDCSALAAHCGDGVLQRATEACDDGDELDGNGCNPDCVVSGTVRWSDIVDGTDNGLSDDGEAVAVSPDGSIFVTGTADSSGPTHAKIWLRRYASDGTVVWTEIRSEMQELYAADLQFLDTGALVVGAFTDEVAGGRFPSVFAYSLDGVPDWAYTHTEPRTRLSLAAVSDGFIALATDVSQSAWLRSFEPDGMPVWTVEPPLMVNQSDIASFPDGGFVIAGTFDGSDVWVRRFTADADELWTQMLEGHGAVGGIAVTDEQIVVAGYGADYWVQSLDRDGGLEWSDSRSEPDGWFFAFDVATSAEGDVFVVGQRKQAADPDLGRLYVARYSSAGALMWEQAHASPFLAAGTAYGSGIAVDGVGDVVVVGTASSDTDSDVWILKLAP